MRVRPYCCTRGVVMSKGAATLDGEWQTVTEENKAGFRFFKVVVEVPYRRMKTLAIPLW